MSARVWVGRTPSLWYQRLPWMWRCESTNQCPLWHYAVDDCGWAETHAEALRLGIAHAAMPHPIETDD